MGLQGGGCAGGVGGEVGLGERVGGGGGGGHPLQWWQLASYSGGVWGWCECEGRKQGWSLLIYGVLALFFILFLGGGWGWWGGGGGDAGGWEGGGPGRKGGGQAGAPTAMVTASFILERWVGWGWCEGQGGSLLIYGALALFFILFLEVCGALMLWVQGGWARLLCEGLKRKQYNQTLQQPCTTGCVCGGGGEGQQSSR